MAAAGTEPTTAVAARPTIAARDRAGIAVCAWFGDDMYLASGDAEHGESTWVRLGAASGSLNVHVNRRVHIPTAKVHFPP